jgi:hypothetical protein
MISRNSAHKVNLAFWLAFVLFASLACNLLRPKVTLPEETIPVTTQAVENLEQEIEAAATQAESTGKATVVIDEAELTSLVAFELQKQETAVIQLPQVFLRDGQIQIGAMVVQGDASLPVQIIAAVKVDADGQPVFELVSAAIGSVALPADLVNTVSDQLTGAFDRNIRPQMGDIFIQTITIADGKMTIEGTKK